jgi:hypothetical protein
LGMWTSTQYIAQASKIAARDMTSGANQKLTFRRSQVKRAVTLLFARVLIPHLPLTSYLVFLLLELITWVKNQAIRTDHQHPSWEDRILVYSIL